MNNKILVLFSVIMGGLTLAMPLLAQSQTVPAFASIPRSMSWPATSAVEVSAPHFTTIQVQHYDAGMMAGLITQPGGIVIVPPNFVVSALPQIAGGFPVRQGASAPAASQPAASVGTAANLILPPGIKKIYALESNNTLVIESEP